MSCEAIEERKMQRGAAHLLSDGDDELGAGRDGRAIGGRDDSRALGECGEREGGEKEEALQKVHGGGRGDSWSRDVFCLSPNRDSTSFIVSRSKLFEVFSDTA